MELKIQKWGNSSAIRLPASLLAQIGVQAGDALEGEVIKGKLVLQAAKLAMPKNDAAVAAMQFAVDATEGMEFLRQWLYGNFDLIRKEWPEAPESVFIGADPMHKAT